MSGWTVNLECMKLDFENPFSERTPRIVAAAKLHRAAARRKAQAFIVEGENSVEAAIATGAARDVFITEIAAQRCEPLVRLAGHMNVYLHPISERAAKYLSDTTHTPGIFAVCDPVLWSMGKALVGTPRLISVPVETNDPGNAGTLIRVSDAVGADAVIFAGETVDPQSSKAVRASAGSLFHLPVVRETNIKDVLGQLRSRGLQILATTADGEVDLDEAEELLAKPTAWLFGNEAHGLSKELLQAADHRVRIPIRGRAESLNLATAASICLYESAKVQYKKYATAVD
ncbi:rRNA methylase [Corynebacterium kutscheri]|uniref:23S ribosomal RNA methyltransferase n=2 Tax=Corynebacterium kutscheri TaxID=35755 RepID=A0A0F6QZF8_9CORY|nr:rRNA methylase [Corynebacterium kutscheri]VEH07040.1 23S ribosomal RNA methyltransferase [Corynebacterium kutscheri]VEH09450.1 23S ribosomal RNA methyltransferase [Corynebacterium kutscheri]